MKAISMQQPWAWAIAAGLKTIENRSWRLGYRGPIAVHASSRRDWLKEFPVWEWKRMLGQLPLDELEFGAVVAVARVTAVVPVERCRNRPFASGPWCWVLNDVRRLPKAVPFKGRQGIFEVPDELLRLDELPDGPWGGQDEPLFGRGA